MVLGDRTVSFAVMYLSIAAFTVMFSGRWVVLFAAQIAAARSASRFVGAVKDW